MTKPFWQSKTLWLNAAVLATTWLLNHKGVMADAGLDADSQVAILAACNMIRRWFTSEPLTKGTV